MSHRGDAVSDDAPRIYVAGASHERLTVVRPLMEAVVERGFVNAYDWTRAPGFDGPAAPEVDERVARDELNAIDESRLFWYVAPGEHKSEGSATELGYALAILRMSLHMDRLPNLRGIIVSGPSRYKLGRIFPRLVMSTLSFEHHEEAIAFLGDYIVDDRLVRASQATPKHGA